MPVLRRSRVRPDRYGTQSTCTSREAMLADDVAPGVEALDRDVHVARPMHGRARRRLGDDQQLRPRARPSRWAAARRSSPRRPWSRSRRSRLDLGRCAARRPSFVTRSTAIAEEREVIVGEPVDEPPSFTSSSGSGGGSRSTRGDLARLCGLRLPVVDGGAHVVEHADEVGGERLQRSLLVT